MFSVNAFGPENCLWLGFMVPSVTKRKSLITDQMKESTNKVWNIFTVLNIIIKILQMKWFLNVNTVD